MSSINFPRPLGYRENNINRINERIDALLADYAKILVVRVDFYIRKDHILDIDHAFMVRALAQLRNNMRYNQLFNGCITYMAKLEHTHDRGWHYHMAFIFNGHARQSDYYLAEQIGQYWATTITGMLGHSHSCHTTAYTHHGIGMVDYHDEEKIACLKQALAYLAKYDVNSVQGIYLDASGKNIRTFFMSQYQPKVTEMGRPRLMKY